MSQLWLRSWSGTLMPIIAKCVSAVFHPIAPFRRMSEWKHRTVSEVSRFVGQSLRCCVCCTKFSTRTRLVAHLTDNRCRGRRQFSCGEIIRSGLVGEVSEQEFSRAHLQDRELRKQARKRGLTQPRALFPAKRMKIGASISAVAMSCTDDIPSNRLNWHAVPPAKRLRRKTPLDEVATGWVRR